METKFIPQVSRVVGISDKRRMPRLGKIRLGIKAKSKKTGNEYPVETDYFVCPPEVQAKLGEEQPKKLKIMFPINDIAAVFPQSYTYYGKSQGVKCKGDGQIAWRSEAICSGDCMPGEHVQKNFWHKRTCPCEHLDHDCGLVGHLLFILPDVSMGGVWQLDTGSFHSTIDVNSGIDYVRELMEGATGQDRFALIPLTLERVPRQTGGGESGGRQTHYTLRLTCDITLKELANFQKNPSMIMVDRLALPSPEEHNPAFEPADVLVDVEDEEKQAPKVSEVHPVEKMREVLEEQKGSAPTELAHIIDEVLEQTKPAEEAEHYEETEEEKTRSTEFYEIQTFRVEYPQIYTAALVNTGLVQFENDLTAQMEKVLIKKIKDLLKKVKPLAKEEGERVVGGDDN